VSGFTEYTRESQMKTLKVGFAVNIQDQVIKSRNYEKHSLGVKVTGRCRKCDKVGEIIEHSIEPL
jgi:hypothetical protein